AKLIDESVKSETRSMTSYQAFSSSVATQQANAETANPFGRSRVSLKAFIDARSQFLTQYKKEEVK
ncbi:MAG: hypothetical protein AAF802_16670, partial [Planctomycetota bacterium]